MDGDVGDEAGLPVTVDQKATDDDGDEDDPAIAGDSLCKNVKMPDLADTDTGVVYHPLALKPHKAPDE